MDISNTRLKELLDKYLEGTASEGEIREVDEWYGTFESHPGLTDQLSPDQRMALEQLLFSRISREIGQAQPGLKVVHSRTRYWWAAAAVVILLAAGGAYLMMDRTTGQGDSSSMVAEAAEKANIKKITLQDGSTVWLNADSKVRYAQAYDREIWLEGEGYFEIAPQQGKAFLVHTGKLDVQVLGTSFNINAYAPRDSIMVTVASGKVAVRTENNADIPVAANQQAVYRTAVGSIKTSDMPATDVGAWREGLLIFKNARFESIALTLERRYNVRIRFDGQKTSNVLLSARFGRDATIKDILRMLCDIYGFNFRQESGGDDYLIYDDQRHQ